MLAGHLWVLGLAALTGIGMWFAVAVERGPIGRSEVELFARRHQLTVTATNGDRLIAYLALTKRWRATGLAGGLLVSAGPAMVHGTLRLESTPLFAGWFIGALIAELRLMSTSHGPCRAAFLAPRRAGAYLPRMAWALLPVAAAASLAVGVVTAVAALHGRHVGAGATPLAAAAMALAGVVIAVQVRILRRAQPISEQDILAADDAIRSRSLRVLAGGGTSLVLFCVLGQLDALAPALPVAIAQGVRAFNVLGFFAVALLGWAIAVPRWPVRRRREPPPEPLGGTP